MTRGFQALSRRGDYQSVKSDLDRQNVKLAIAKNVRWPKLDLVSSLQLNDISQSYQTALRRYEQPQRNRRPQFQCSAGKRGRKSRHLKDGR